MFCYHLKAEPIHQRAQPEVLVTQAIMEKQVSAQKAPRPSHHSLWFVKVTILPF